MATQIILVILIIALIIYSIYLQVQLTKKNIFIESTVRRLSLIEKSRSMEEMITFLSEIQRLSQYSSVLSDKLLEKDTVDFIFENIKNLKIYMHYTKDENDAKSILSNGFRFVDSFYKTALPVSKDKLDFKVKHSNRKLFGDYVIIIGIASDTVNFYSSELEKAGIKRFSFENLLTEEPPVMNENADMIYQLPSQFVKGYVNHRTGEIVRNPVYDPFYNTSGFRKNLESLMSR
jgi:hypothetical protein